MNSFSFSFPFQFSSHRFSFPLRTLANETLREITLNIYFWDDCSRRLGDKHHYVMYINPPSGYSHTFAHVNTYKGIQTRLRQETNDPFYLSIHGRNLRPPTTYIIHPSIFSSLYTNRTVRQSHFTSNSSLHSKLICL